MINYLQIISTLNCFSKFLAADGSNVLWRFKQGDLAKEHQLILVQPWNDCFGGRDWEMRWLSPICNLSLCVLVMPELVMAHILDGQKYQPSLTNSLLWAFAVLLVSSIPCKKYSRDKGQENILHYYKRERWIFESQSVSVCLSLSLSLSFFFQSDSLIKLLMFGSTEPKLNCNHGTFLF